MDKITELTWHIVDLFEDCLEGKGVEIPNEEKTGSSSDANIYGQHYTRLENCLHKYVKDSVIITTEAVYMEMEKQPHTEGSVRALLNKLHEQEHAWHDNRVADIMVSELRNLLTEACGENVLDHDDVNHLTDAINEYLSEQIGRFFRSAIDKADKFLKKGNFSEKATKAVHADITNLLFSLNEVLGSGEKCTYALFTVRDRQMELEEFKYLTLARQTMFKQMCEYAKLDPMLVALSPCVESADTSYWRGGYSAWTSSNSAEYAECQWEIEPIPVGRPVTLMVVNTNHNVRVRKCACILGARLTMREELASQCYNEEVKKLVWSHAAYTNPEGFYSFDLNEASCCTKPHGDSFADWKIFNLHENKDLDRSGAHICITNLNICQRIKEKAAVLEDPDQLVSEYNAALDAIPGKVFNIPHQWIVDFGGGWEMHIDVITPHTGYKDWKFASYARATLIHNNEVMIRSDRYGKVSGAWGLCYAGILFQVVLEAK